jgi:hypothetical protein
VLLPEDQSSEQDVVYLGDDKPVSLKPPSASCQKRINRTKACSIGVQEGEDKVQTEQSSKQQQQQLKRGQRGKLKKINKKYKYQDEEERKLRMDILQVGPRRLSGGMPQVSTYGSCGSSPTRLKLGKYMWR